MAIQHIHSRQILHRDLKTQNIFLDKNREIIKVGDFGISKILDSKSKAVSVVGTPCYISPELCKGQPYNQKSDVWAVGCILYEMLTLKRAFHAENLPALVMKIMKGQGRNLQHFYYPYKFKITPSLFLKIIRSFENKHIRLVYKMKKKGNYLSYQSSTAVENFYQLKENSFFFNLFKFCIDLLERMKQKLRKKG